MFLLGHLLQKFQHKMQKVRLENMVKWSKLLSKRVSFRKIPPKDPFHGVLDPFQLLNFLDGNLGGSEVP